MVNRRAGLISAVAGTLALGAATAGYVVDRRIASRRRVDLTPLTDEPSDRHGVLAADDGVGLYYEEVGPEDAPLTIVFSHGFCLSMEAFVLQRRALRLEFGEQVRMVFVDHRSHGRSDRSDPERATVDQLGRDLATVLDALAPSGPLVVVGHSMGGMAVLALAGAHPELFRGPRRRVDAVALISTSTGKLAGVTFGLPAALTRVSSPVVPILLRGARRRADFVERGRAIGTDLTWIFTKWLSFAREVDPEVVEFCTNMIASTRIETVADFYSTLMRHDKLRALDVLRSVDLVVICGDRDLMTPLEHSRAIADALPAARLVVVPDAGHMALLEAPEEVDAPLVQMVSTVLGELSRSAPRPA